MEILSQDGKSFERGEQKSSLKMIAILATIATGVNFGWALQFSLLTPYVQLIGIPHKWTSFIWLCGPISGTIIPPIIGYQSDKCRSQWGRRRPFMIAGLVLVLISIFLISFAVDFGRLVGDSLGSRVKPKAITIFVTGFWIFDVGNNTLQGPARAFLADLAGKSQQRTRNAFLLYAFFGAVGNILGYAAGSISHLYKFLPFTKTAVCNTDCANLKTCFIIFGVLLLTLTVTALSLVQDRPPVGPIIDPTSEVKEMVRITSTSKDPTETDDKTGVTTPVTSMERIKKALGDLPKPMWVLLAVTGLNWLAWNPFLLYDTDWMGREVYGGEVGVGKRYSSGFHAGALGLMLNSVVLACTCLGVEYFIRKVGGVRKLWGCVNFFLALCMGLTVLIAKLAKASRSGGSTQNPPLGIRLSALALFAALGIPLGVTYSIPFAMASMFSNTSGAGQGLTIGILNFGIVIPQIIVSLTSGPWDSLFGGGNLPSFVVGSIAAAASGIVVLTLLPSPPPPDLPTSRTMTMESSSSS